MFEVKRVYIEVDPIEKEASYEDTIIQDHIDDGWEPFSVRAENKYEDWFFKRPVQAKKKPGRPPKGDKE